MLDPNDINGAYATQAINTRQWLSEARRLVGRKIGLTAKTVQAQLGVEQPDFGALFADMQVLDGGVLDLGRAMQPKVEAEIAFVLARDIDDPDATMEVVTAAIDHAVAAIEIVDNRSPDSISIPAAWSWRSTARLPRWVRGAACLGHPLNSVQRLARTLAASGEALKAGDILLSGALGPMVTLTPGDQVRARISGIGICAFSYGTPA
jgi:2-keto-4-pentenoate hydratase